jgi:hypothetical protein
MTNRSLIVNMTHLTFQFYKDRFLRFSYSVDDYLVQIFRSLGVLCTILNTIIFLKKDLIKKSSLYLQIMSILDGVYLFRSLATLDIVNRCQASSTLCGEATQNFVLEYNLAISDFLSSSMAIFAIILEIFLSIQRFFMLLNKNSLQKSNPYIVSLVIGIVSIIYYFPLLFNKEIVRITVLLNDTEVIEHRLVLTSLGKSNAGKILPAVMSLMRMVLSGCVLLIVNILNIIVYIKYVKQNNKIANKSDANHSKANPKLSLMLIMTANVYLVCQLPLNIDIIVKQIDPTIQSSFVDFLFKSSRILLGLLVITKTVIYILFNKLYKEAFLDLALCRTKKNTQSSVKLTSTL